MRRLWENSPLYTSWAGAPEWIASPRAQPALASQFRVSLDVRFQGVGNLWPHHREEMAKDKSTISTNPRISSTAPRGSYGSFKVLLCFTPSHCCESACSLGNGHAILP